MPVLSKIGQTLARKWRTPSALTKLSRELAKEKHIDVKAAYDEILKEYKPGELIDIMKAAGEEPGIAGPLMGATDPQYGNAIVRSAWHDQSRAELARSVQMQDGMKQLMSSYGNVDTAKMPNTNKLIWSIIEAKQFTREEVEAAVKEGMTAQEFRQIRDFWTAKANDIADMVGLSWDNPSITTKVKRIANYMPHMRDRAATYNIIRQKYIDGNVADLEKIIDPEHGASVERILQRFPDWNTMPELERDVIKEQVFKWITHVHDIDSLPPHVRDLISDIPKEKFSPFMQKRVIGYEYPMLDAKSTMILYLASMLRKIHYDPLIDRIRPAMLKLKRTNPTRTYIEKQTQYLLGGKKSTFDVHADRAMERISRWLNEFGIDWAANPNVATRATSRVAKHAYAGAISIDTAIQNPSQQVYDLFDKGPTRVGKGLIEYVQNKVSGKGTIPEVLRNQFEIKQFEGVSRSRLSKIDDKIIMYSLSPMHWTENFNKGVGYTSAYIQAIERGLDPEQAMLISFAKASKTMENPAMSQAMYQAMTNTLKTQFGYTAAHIGAFWQNPLGRLSSIFMSFPRKSMQMILRGFADDVALKDTSGMFRWMALLGFEVALPLTLAKVGVDVYKTFGIGKFPSSYLSMPFQLVADGARMITGQPRERINAEKAFKKTLLTMTIPQYRTMAQGKEAFENAMRGHRLGYRNRRMYETSTFEEMVAWLTPVDPIKRKEIRDALRQGNADSWEWTHERANYIDDVVSALDNGNRTKADKLFKESEELGLGITMDDIKEEMVKKQTPVMQRRFKTLPKAVREKWRQRYERLYFEG